MLAPQELQITSIKEYDALEDEGQENSFRCCKANSVFCHPGGELPVETIQGQKCLCCLIGSNSIALSDSSGSLFFPGNRRDQFVKIST